uniref:Uncharacterized protein n=1 Tax=Amphimedon queenslandica TaxID=400682 RepID=A0A1X7U7J8_AMPQE
MLSGIILYQTAVTTTPHFIEEYIGTYIIFQYNNYCIGTVPQLVLLLINEQEYHCSLASPTTNNCTVTTGDINNNVNVTINISEVLEYGAKYTVKMSLFTINNVDFIHSNDFTFKFSKYVCIIYHTKQVYIQKYRPEVDVQGCNIFLFTQTHIMSFLLLYCQLMTQLF